MSWCGLDQEEMEMGGIDVEFKGKFRVGPGPAARAIASI